MCSLLKSEILFLSIDKKLLAEITSTVNPAGSIFGYNVEHKSSFSFKHCSKASS